MLTFVYVQFSARKMFVDFQFCFCVYMQCQYCFCQTLRCIYAFHVTYESALGQLWYGPSPIAKNCLFLFYALGEYFCLVHRFRVHWSSFDVIRNQYV